MLLLRLAFCLSESNIFPDATLPLKVTFSVMQFGKQMRQLSGDIMMRIAAG